MLPFRATFSNQVNNIFMFTENKSTYALLYAFIIKTFKYITLFRNIQLSSLAQSVEQWTRYFNIIRNRQYKSLDCQIMALKQLIYLVIVLSFTQKLKNKNVPVVWLELGTSRSAGEHLNHYTTEYTRKSRLKNTIHKCRCIDFNEFSNLE